MSPRSGWYTHDLFADDDPGIVNGRRPFEVPRNVHPDPAPEPLERPETPVPVQAATSRRDRVSALVQRVRAGDLSAVDGLRRALEEIR